MRHVVIVGETELDEDCERYLSRTQINSGCDKLSVQVRIFLKANPRNITKRYHNVIPLRKPQNTNLKQFLLEGVMYAYVSMNSSRSQLK